MSKSKYRKGAKINSIAEFAACKSLWYKWRERTVHRKVLENLQYGTLDMAIMGGSLYTAEKNEEVKCEECKFYGHSLDEKVGTDVCYTCHNKKYFKPKEAEKSCKTCKHQMVVDCGAYPCNECDRKTLLKYEAK